MVANATGPAPPRPRLPAPERGFTLIEMLFVVMIAGILMTIMMPGFRRSRIGAEAADVIRRVEGINVAIKTYEADTNQPLPIFTGPEGAPPAFLQPYVSTAFFQGPGAISFQLVRTGEGQPPTLVISAGTGTDEQILLAATRTLGSGAFVLGGGSSMTVSLTH